MSTTVHTEYLSLRQAAERTPPTKGDKPVHPSTVGKWVTRGVRLRDGSRLRLAAIRYPGGWKLTADSLAAFLDRLTADSLGEDSASGPSDAPEPARVTAGRRHELARVDRELASRGLGMDPSDDGGAGEG
jgi:hypothetical protein